MKTTNYYNTFIEVAEDCPASGSEVPPEKGDKKTVASIQFELVSKNPYKYTSDEVLFRVFAIRNDISEEEEEGEWKKFFSKGQACFRSSPLAKRYGWGIHSDSKGRIALVPVGSDEYERLVKDKNLEKVKAMRSKRA